MGQLVTQLTAPVHHASHIRPAGEESVFGAIEQKNIFDLGISPGFINEVMTFKFKNSYFPYIFSLFEDRVEAIPHEKYFWREKKELLVRGKVVSTATGNGAGLTSIQLNVLGYEDTLKEWWLAGSHIKNEAGRDFYISAVEKVGSGGIAQKITIKPFDGIPLTVAGNVSADFANGSTFGEISVVRGRKTNLTQSRNVDFIEYGNVMTTVNSYISMDKDAFMNRPLWSFDRGNGKMANYYPTQLEIEMSVISHSMANNAIFHGALNKNIANIDAIYGASIYQQIHDDCKQPYTTLSLNDFKNAIKRWKQLNPDNPVKEALVISGTEASADIQNIMEGAQPLIRTSPGNYQRIEKNIAVGQEYVSYYWDGVFLTFKECSGLDSTNTQPKLSPVNPQVSIYSHDILMFDMGTKNGLVRGEEQGQYKISMKCPKNPDGSKGMFQAITKPGTIDGSGNQINGVVSSFNDGVEKQFINSFMINVEDKHAIYNLNIRD